jgi:hypothetical protein
VKPPVLVLCLAFMHRKVRLYYALFSAMTWVRGLHAGFLGETCLPLISTVPPTRLVGVTLTPVDIVWLELAVIDEHKSAACAFFPGEL